MSDGGYKIRNQQSIHFITFAVVGWADVFTRKEYRDIVLDSIKYCQAEKVYCFIAGLVLDEMSNHPHLNVSVKNHDLSDLLRDFKKYTSKLIVFAIEGNQHESWRAWMLVIFKKEGEKNSRNKNYQFWRHDNRPPDLLSLPNQ